MNAGARGVQKKLLDPLALKLPTVVTHLMWLLAAEPKSLPLSAYSHVAGTAPGLLRTAAVS